MSERVAKEFLSTNGNVFTSLGLTQDAALGLSNEVAKLGVDLASFTNFSGGAEGAISAVSKALIGEREQLKGLGIAILDTDLKDFAAQSGKTFEALSKQEKATLTLELVTKLAGNAVGDFARSNESWANTQRKVEAAVEDSAAKIGQSLLPEINRFTNALLESERVNGTFTKAASLLGSAIGALIGPFTDQLELQNKWAKSLREQNDEIFRTEAQIKETKKALSDYGVQLAQAQGKQGTATEGVVAFEAALKDGDIEARRLSDSVKDLSEDLDSLRFASESITDPLGATSKLLSNSFKLARESSAKRRKQIARTEKARKIAFDRRIARLQAEVDIARLTGNEIVAIELESNKRIVEIENDKFLARKQKSELIAAIEKKTEDDITAYKIQKANELANITLGSANNLFSALSALSQAQTQNRLNDLDIQLARALEVAGVAEETSLQKAENELEEAKKSGDKDLILEKQNAVKREKIIEEFEKKKRQIEYQGALTVWEFQVAQAVASAALAVANAIAAGWKFGPIGAALYGAAAGAAGAVQIAAVLESKPQPPKFQDGGIVPGENFSGDNVPILANSGEAVLTQEQQSRLLSLAEGGTAGGQVAYRVSPIQKDVLLDDLFQASQDGRLLIADKAVVRT